MQEIAIYCPWKGCRWNEERSGRAVCTCSEVELKDAEANGEELLDCAQFEEWKPDDRANACRDS